MELEAEVLEHIPDIVAHGGCDPAAYFAEWERYKKKVHLFRAEDDAPVDITDPDDACFIRASRIVPLCVCERTRESWRSRRGPRPLSAGGGEFACRDHTSKIGSVPSHFPDYPHGWSASVLFAQIVRRELAMSLEHGEDLDDLRLDSVDDPIAAFDDFADACPRKLGY